MYNAFHYNYQIKAEMEGGGGAHAWTCGAHQSKLNECFEDFIFFI